MNRAANGGTVAGYPLERMLADARFLFRTGRTVSHFLHAVLFPGKAQGDWKLFVKVYKDKWLNRPAKEVKRMRTVALVEDEEAVSRGMQRMLKQFEQTHGCPLDVTAFSSAESFLDAAEKKPFEIVLMDIDLPGMNGMEAARFLRRRDRLAVLIFTTNLSQYAVQGYEVQAMDYCLKPVTYAMLEMKLFRAVQLCGRQGGAEIRINTRDGFIRVAAETVISVEIYQHHIVYHTETGDYQSYGTMKQVMEELPPVGFFRATASYVVNLRHVKQLTGLDIVMGDRRVPLSRLRKKEFMEAMNQYLNGRMEGGQEYAG